MQFSGNAGCIKKKTKQNKTKQEPLLQSGAISGITYTLLYGLTYNTRGHFAPTRKISARIIC